MLVTLYVRAFLLDISQASERMRRVRHFFGNNMSSRQIGRRGNSPNVDARGFSSKYTWKSHS